MGAFTRTDVINVENLVSGTDAKVFATFPDGRRFSMGNFINFEAKQDFTKTKAPILGNPGGGNRKGPPQNSVTGRMHYNNSEFRKIALEYQSEREDMYFEMLIINEDPTSTVGRQSVSLFGVNLDSIVLAKFDAEAEYLDEDFNATFESWSMDNVFNDTGVRYA